MCWCAKYLSLYYAPGQTHQKYDRNASIKFLMTEKNLGPIHLLNTCKYCVNTRKYWDNTYKYWANTWKMCSPASVILTSIATILVSFEAILKRISVNFNIRSQFQSNFPTISFEIDQNRFKTYKYCDNTCEYYTCRWTHFSSIGSILVSIISTLTSIDTILASIEQVNRPQAIFEHARACNC